MKTNDKTMNRKVMPLVAVASVLSVASLGWTTYSLLDLLKVGAIGLTVAATADLIWSAVIWCEYKGIGNKTFVKTLGWIAVVIVGGFIAWHGISKGSPEMAVAGPFLTLGTKAVWEMVLMALRNPVRDRQRAARDEIDLLDAETEIIVMKAEAQIRKENAESKAQREREIAARKHEHEMDLMEARHAAEKEKVAAESKAEVLLTRLDAMNMEHILSRFEGRVIPGETVAAIEAPQVPVLPAPAAPPVVPPVQPPAVPLSKATVPAATVKTGQVTVQIDNDGGLTEAQRNLKRLAASWYMASVAAKTQGVLLSQSEFARQLGIQKQQVTRALKNFPLEKMTEDDYEDARRSA